MSRNNNDIWTFLHRFAIIVGIIAGIITPTIAVLTFLGIKPFQTQPKTTLPSPEQTPSQPKSETPDRPTQDSTPKRSPDPP
ncbi:MAG: hypothetical protein AB4352_04120, partial [Hormoscilla sp.]